MSLKFIPLSGTTGVTENCYVYENGNDIIIVDCGVGFPEPEMYGVDLIIPDFSYIVENKHKLKAIFITHGHEDHIGALPFLFKELKAPIYATKLVAAFIEDKFEDYEGDIPKVNVIDPDHDVITAGSFKVSTLRVSHSVRDGVGFCIETPEGKAFDVPDYKFDWTPVDGKPFDVRRAASLATSGNVLMLASDSLGSTSPGHTESEAFIEGKIEAIMTKARGQIFFTTISSNISRMQQAMNVAARLNRKVDFVVDHLIEIGAEVHYYDLQEDLHVSGHGSQEDIKLLFGIIKPKYFIPIGGTIRHNRGYANIATDMGNDYKNVFQLKEGDILEVSSNKAEVTGHIPVKSVLVDGLGVGDVGNVVLRDRKVLAREE